MKKLLVILVVFAMVSAVAFAQPTVGGALQIAATIISGDSDSEDVFGGPVSVGDGNMHVNVGFGDSEAGGMLRLYSAKNDNLPGHFDFFAFAWWRPVQFFRVQIGRNPDGDWGADHIVGWGFTAEAKNGVAAMNDYQGGRYFAADSEAFYGGISARSINTSFYLLDNALTLNFGFPLMPPASTTADSQYADFHFNGVFAIEGIGVARLSFEGDQGLVADNETDNLGALSLSFYLSALDGLGLEVGFKTTLPNPEVDADPAMNVGLGLLYSGDGFGIKFRAGAALNGDDTTISANVLPFFPLEGLTLHLYAGLGLDLDKDSNTTIDWFVNPYIIVPAGALKFYTGIRIWQHDIKDGSETPVNFDLQLGFQAYF